MIDDVPLHTLLLAPEKPNSLDFTARTVNVGSFCKPLLALVPAEFFWETLCSLVKSFRSPDLEFAQFHSQSITSGQRNIFIISRMLHHMPSK